MVWEESIILAPKSVRFAFLSATIPNAREFADWVAKTHASPCHVVYTGASWGGEEPAVAHAHSGALLPSAGGARARLCARCPPTHACDLLPFVSPSSRRPADYRPTPLEHYVFPVGGDDWLLVVDQKGTFR